MQTANERLESEKQTIENAEYLTKAEKNTLLDFVQELRNAENISSGHTFAKHLQKLRNISRSNDWDLNQVEVTQDLCKEVRNQIQASDYKQKDGDFSKKNKKDHWTAWKYFIEHIHDNNPDQVLPKASFTSNREKVDTQADTRPEDLPTPEDMRKLLPAIENVSDKKTGRRNAMIYMLIWDLGTRKGETFPIKMKDVDVRKDMIRIFIHGNKESSDGWVRVFQGEKMLREYLQQHPASDDPEAYLFPKHYQDEMHQQVNPRAVKKKMKQARSQADLDFKTYGEPFHIFRKASSTYYVVNDVLSWEEVCKRQRKKPDSTKPDYLLMAMEDIEKSAAEGFGLEETENNDNGFMSGPPLLPKECPGCSRKNTALQNSCIECQTTLPDNQLPKTIHTDIDPKEKAKAELQGEIQNLKKLAEKAGIDLQEL